MHEARCRARAPRCIPAIVCVLGLAGCFFDESPVVPAGVGPSRPSSGEGRDQPMAGSSSGAPTASLDASASDADPPAMPDGGGATNDASALEDASGSSEAGSLGTGGSSAGSGGSGAGTGGSGEPDAGTDASQPDSTAPNCPQGVPACVCAHTRLQTPDDPCAAPDCPLEDCAPDEQCTLQRFASSVYYVCTTPHSQADAQSRCQGIDGMHLVFIESAEEDAFLEGVIAGKVWIGASEDEGVWSWLDGTAFYDDGPVDGAYVNWDDDASEPNGLGVGSGSVTCAILWSETNAWADTNCPAMNGYVCELEH